MRKSSARTGLLWAVVYCLLVACGDANQGTTLSLPSRETRAIPGIILPLTTSRTPSSSEPSPTSAGRLLTAGGEIPLPVSATGGLQEISVDPLISAGMVKEFQGVNNPQAHFYASDDKPDSLTARLHQYFTSDSYRFAFPGQVGPFRQAGALIGLYIKNGEPDVVVGIIPVAGDALALEATLRAIKVPGVDEVRARSLTARLRDRASLLVVLTGEGLLQYMLVSGEASRIATPAGGIQAPPSVLPGTSQPEKGLGSDFYDLRVTNSELPDNINGVIPPAGFRFVALDTTFTSQAAQGVSLMVATAQVLDQKLNQYPLVVAGKEPRLIVPPGLLRGQQARGWLTFQIPSDSRPTILLCTVKTPAGEIITRLVL